METRVAVISMIVEKEGDIEGLNAILHDFSSYIIGRMGIPYRTRNVNIISVVLDAPSDEIASLAGKLGNLPGVSLKTAYSSVQD